VVERVRVVVVEMVVGWVVSWVVVVVTNEVWVMVVVLMS
jgi:hypothetical protein